MLRYSREHALADLVKRGRGFRRLPTSLGAHSAAGGPRFHGTEGASASFRLSQARAIGTAEARGRRLSAGFTCEISPARIATNTSLQPILTCRPKRSSLPTPVAGALKLPFKKSEASSLSARLAVA